MSDDLCQCPTCGRMHKSLGFGTPPETAARTRIETPDALAGWGLLARAMFRAYFWLVRW